MKKYLFFYSLLFILIGIYSIIKMFLFHLSILTDYNEIWILTVGGILLILLGLQGIEIAIKNDKY